MSSLQKAAETALKSCMDLKGSESCLIIYDINKKDIADALFDDAKKITTKAELLEIKEPKISGEEPPKEVAEKMLNYDVILIATSKSISHTKARRDACTNGARIASMPAVVAAALT